MVGVAVKVTEVPEQIVVAAAEILTEGITVGSTVIVTKFDIAVIGLAHVALDAITT